MSLRAPRLLDRLLTLGAVLGGLCLAWAGSTLVLGLTPLVVLSGSMAPAIGTGDLAVARTVAATDVRLGDVVSVVADSGVRVTHRVVGADPVREGAVELVLKGDANAGPDPQTYRVAEVERVWFHVPHLGRVVAASSGRGGTLVAVGLVLLAFGAVIHPRGRSRTKNASSPRHRGTGTPARRVTVGVLAVALLGTGGLVTRATPTVAAFTDTAETSATPTAALLPKPTVACEDLGNELRFRWTASTNPLAVSYRAQLANGSTPPIVTDGATRYVDVYAGLLSSLLGDRTTISVTARTPVSSSWESLPGRYDFTIAVLGLSASCNGPGY